MHAANPGSITVTPHPVRSLDLAKLNHHLVSLLADKGRYFKIVVIAALFSRSGFWLFVFFIRRKATSACFGSWLCFIKTGSYNFV